MTEKKQACEHQWVIRMIQMQGYDKPGGTFCAKCDVPLNPMQTTVTSGEYMSPPAGAIQRWALHEDDSERDPEGRWVKFEDIGPIIEERDRLRAARRIHELDNHHNAAACPYCQPELEAQIGRQRAIVQRADAAEQALVTLRAEAEMKLAYWWNRWLSERAYRKQMGHPPTGRGEDADR